MRSLVLHWLPLERFPPAQNLLRVAASDNRFCMQCCTTFEDGARDRFEVDGVRVYRTGFPLGRLSRLRRLWRFLVFPLMCLWVAIRHRPQVVLYYEPHSALAAFLTLLVRPRARLLIHYHEYRELPHYRDRGNLLARVGFWLESRWLFRRAVWISQTNPDRCRLFLKDCPAVNSQVLRSLPNYPPANWAARAGCVRPAPGRAVRLVYVGAVSLHDTYIREVVRWVKSHAADQLTLDLFVHSMDARTADFLRAEQSAGLRVVFGGVPYDSLPETLAQFDVGLIIYRCTTTNYVYNAPNKLFEYLVCGLGVLYPQQMLGVAASRQAAAGQRVRSVCYEQIDSLDPACLPRGTAAAEDIDCTSESVYGPLLEACLVD